MFDVMPIDYNFNSKLPFFFFFDNFLDWIKTNVHVFNITGRS